MTKMDELIRAAEMLQRYDIETWPNGAYGKTKDNYGDFVLWEDIESILAAAKKAEQTTTAEQFNKHNADYGWYTACCGENAVSDLTKRPLSYCPSCGKKIILK